MSITDKYKPESQIPIVASEDKPKEVGKLNVKEFKLESTVEVKKGQQNDLAEIKPQVGKLKVGWNPVSTVEVKAQQNDAAEIRKGGKLNPNDFIKTGAEEPKPEKKGPLSMEELVKADMRDN